MSQYVTDTHPLLWHISGDPRLSAVARTIFTEADAGLHQILVPGIVLVEAVYLAEKKRIDPLVVDQLFFLLDLGPANYAAIPLEVGVVRILRTINRAAVPDMPDRIIVATAKHLGLDLVTKDHDIATSGIVAVIW